MYVELAITATVLGSLTLGLMLGFFAGWAHGRAKLMSYIQGRDDEHRSRAELEAARGGPCWVKGMLPPEADE